MQFVEYSISSSNFYNMFIAIFIARDVQEISVNIQ